MIVKKSTTILGALTPLLLAVACSGGSGVSITEPDQGSTGSNQQSTPDPTAAAAATTSVSGRVADGYIQGATICVDINENGACDSDEPQTVSTAGGEYHLDIPEDAADAPILAIVPPTAIDEDTGEAIGKELHFSTPGDKPLFLSPITTLVHQELKDNPSLSTEDAEAAVLETLGMPDETEASLFTDYVAQSKQGDDDTREKFNYLHQTARVVASMMGDIQEDIKTAAEEGGLDVSGDTETQAAIRQLVQDELRELLPEISAAVAERISEMQEANTTDDAGTPIEPPRIDPENIAGDLIPQDVTEEVVTQIDAIKAENPPQAVSMKTLLSNGFYILDIDCHHQDVVGQEDGIDDQASDQTAMILNDDGAPQMADLPEHCEAHYSHISMHNESGELQDSSYYYDTQKQQWVQDDWEDDTDHPHMLVLEDGEWIAMSDGGPSGVVEFTDDGAAVLASEGGKMLVYAIEKVLDNTSILHHLKNRGAEDSIIDLVEPAAVFGENASVYRLHIKRDADLTVLFNWYPEYEDDGTNHCAEFGGNCNVVGEYGDNGFTPATTLADIQQGSLSGLTINDLVYDETDYHPIDAKLEASGTSNGELPEAGTVSWMKPLYMTQHATDSGEEQCYTPEVPTDVEQKQSADGSTDKPEDEHPYVECDHQFDPEQQHQVLADESGTSASNSTDEASDERLIATSDWKKVRVNGETMIEIDIPIAVRHRIEQDETAAMLLIEHNGFVRRGARFGDRSVDDEVAYNEIAFDTLKPIIERYISQ